VGAIGPGDTVMVRTALGDWRQRRAVTGVELGDRFAVVWACRLEEWDAAQAEGRDPETVPWPAEDVRLAEESEGSSPTAKTGRVPA
jgi:hypothetical protein